MVSITALGGTLILFFNTPHGMYMTADSRLTNTAPPGRDRAQKVFQCGKTGVCGVSGNLVFDAVTTDDATGKRTPHHLDLTAVLTSASARVPAGTGQKQAEFLAARLQGQLRSYWRLAFDGKRMTERMNDTRRASESNVCTVLFAKREGGTVEIFEIRFPFKEVPFPGVGGAWANYLLDPGVRKLDATQEVVRAQGETACAAPIKHPDQIRSRTAVLRTINDIYAAASRVGGICSQEIGGPVDIAVVDNNGFRWLQRKP